MTLTGKLDTATLKAMVSESLAKRFPGLRVENITLPYISSYDSSFELSDETEQASEGPFPVTPKPENIDLAGPEVF